MTEKVAQKSLAPGDHGTTYGGNPLACAAVNEVLRQFEERNITAHVRELSGYLSESLEKLKEKSSHIKEIRGTGFMRGIELDTAAGEFVKKAQEKGLILITAGTNIIRIVPPLVFEKEHIDEMCRIIGEVLSLT